MTNYSPTHRKAVSYIDKSRELYLHRGFNNPYRWASHDHAPFAPLNKPLSECTIGVVTTAVPNAEAGKNRKLWSSPTDPIPQKLFTDHISIHKQEVDTSDLGTFLPLSHLNDAVKQGRIGQLGSRFYGIRTTFSQRASSQEDGPAVLEMARQDGVDALIMVPL